MFGYEFSSQLSPTSIHLNQLLQLFINKRKEVMMAGRERKSESNKTKEGKLDEMELLVKQRNEGQVRRGAELITRSKERRKEPLSPPTQPLFFACCGKKSWVELLACRASGREAWCGVAFIDFMPGERHSQIKLCSFHSSLTSINFTSLSLQGATNKLFHFNHNW